MEEINIVDENGKLVVSIKEGEMIIRDGYYSVDPGEVIDIE